MDADALFLSDVSDDLVAENRMAALGNVRSNRVEAVNDDSVIAVRSSRGIGPGASCRLCVAGSSILKVNTCLVRIDAQGVYLSDIVIKHLLGSLGSLCFRALGITCLVSLAEFDRELVRAVSNVAVSSYTVAQSTALLFRNIADIVVTET